MNLLLFFLAIFPILVSGLKCWTNDPNGNPYKYPGDVAGADFCVRYKFACDGSGGLCQGKSVGTRVTVYTAVGANSIEAISKNIQMYIEPLVCNTDYCNGPDAVVKPTATNSPDAVVKPTATNSTSGGSRNAATISIGFLLISTLIFFLL